MSSLVKNAADAEQVKEAGDKAQRNRRQELDQVRLVVGTSLGRAFYWRLLQLCGVFQSSFNHSGSITAFNEGQRNIGLKLLADLNEAAPEAYVTMMRESKTNV